MNVRTFNQFFYAIVAVCALLAFVVPARFTDVARAPLEGLFAPVSRPSRWVAAAVFHRARPERSDDPRPAESVGRENDALRQEVVRLQTDVDRLEKLEAERQQLGDLQALCQHYAVSGTDAGPRDALLLVGARLGGGLSVGSPVLYKGGLAGRIESGGPAGARVRLVTDLGAHCTGAFVRFVPGVDGSSRARRIASPAPFVEGAGQNRLVIRSPLSMRDVEEAGLAVHDWVVLSDNNWPTAVQGVRLGQITAIANRVDYPQFAEIRVAPETVLTRLTDVWVLGDKPAAKAAGE